MHGVPSEMCIRDSSLRVAANPQTDAVQRDFVPGLAGSVDRYPKSDGIRRSPGRERSRVNLRAIRPVLPTHRTATRLELGDLDVYKRQAQIPRMASRGNAGVRIFAVKAKHRHRFTRRHASGLTRTHDLAFRLKRPLDMPQEGALKSGDSVSYTHLRSASCTIAIRVPSGTLDWASGAA